MAELEKGKPISLEELMVTTLAMADAVTKLLNYPFCSFLILFPPQPPLNGNPAIPQRLVLHTMYYADEVRDLSYFCLKGGR